MKVLFDTNVILDVILKRMPFYNDSRSILYMASQREIAGFVSASSITDIYYLTEKTFRNTESAQKAIYKLLEVVYAADTKGQDIKSALKLGFPDFEDAVVCAVAIREKADFIITRNVKDFALSPVRAVSPKEFLLLNA
jgi:predicted nucleic acid-binding protein